MNWRTRVFRPAIALAAAAAVQGGCAARPKIAADRPPALQSLAELPPIQLPPPAARPTTPAPAEALQRYAQGRDALLQDKKRDAQIKLQAALKLDPASAVAHHDLGYAFLGLDNTRAAAEFNQATAYDPLDADSRVQLARLLLNDKKFQAAVDQLRLARLSPDAADDDSLSAMIDLLLGRLLQASRPTAALECYEHVIALIDDGKLQLRGRPELAELLRQPDILVIQAGDLALAVGQFPKAADLYDRVKRDNPQAAGVLEMRIAGAELSAGHTDQATRRALAIVEKQQASFSSVAAYIGLFDQHGGVAGALRQLDGLKPTPGEDVSSRCVLRSQLLLRTDDAPAAMKEIDQAARFDLPAVRQTVHAYRAAGQGDVLIQKLLERTAAGPSQWPAIMRGWAMLSQLGQPQPLLADRLAATAVPPKLEAAKLLVTAQLRLGQGEPVAAKNLIGRAQANDPALAAALTTGPASQVTPDDAFDDVSGLVDLILDNSDDPELLAALVGELLQQGQKQLVQAALHLASGRQPKNVVLASSYAQVLADDEQRTEAIAVLDRAAAAPSASELYFLSSQYSALNENASAEKVLRRALAIDPNNVAVCNDLGYLLTDAGRELDMAESLLLRAVGVAPQNPAYLDSLGWLLYKRSKFGDAARYLGQALAASDPADPVVLDHAGDAYYRDNQADKAAAAWNQAVIAIRNRGTSDPQLRLRVERKLRQAAAKQAVDLAPLAMKN